MKYYNYHCHSMYGNPVSLDVIIKPEDYCKRAIELGHDALFTTCHGLQGNIFEATTLAHNYNLKLIVGAELYYVPNRREKDKSNRHIIIIAKNHDGIRDINSLISESFISGRYYKPRIDHELLFSISPDNVIITTACIAGVWNDEALVKELKDYFKENFFLEVQNHNQEGQKEVNRTVLKLSKKYDIPIIHANDSHYIYPQNKEVLGTANINGKPYDILPADRDLFLKAKGIIYAEETDFVLDYPDYDTVVDRYMKQGVLSKNKIEEALKNTLVFENIDCSDYITDDIKLPSVSDNPNEELKKIINESWEKERHKIPKENWNKYIKEIRYEMDIIEKTNMANYFLIDYHIAKIAKEKYNGVLTKTGRGCFIGDTLIHTIDGLKFLKEIKKGDYVVTESGELNKVLNTFCYDIEESMVEIQHICCNNHFLPSICTLDHEILIYRDKKKTWVKAEDVRIGDFVCFPKVKFNDNYSEKININEMNNYINTICKTQYPINLSEKTEGILMDNDYYYFLVKKVERIRKQPFKVYDLEVENNHSYVLNNMIVHNSAPSFYVIKLLGLTNIDRIASPITLFPTRFMSIERILGARSLPDIDLNTADASPFIEASADLLGEKNCGWMISWKPLQEASGFRLYCKAIGMDIDEYNEVAKNIDKYRNDKNWGKIIEASKPFIGVVEGISESPCSELLYDKDISREIGLIETPNGKICCLLDGYNCDKYKYLKNDYLTVTVWAIIRDVCSLANIPIPDINELENLLDEKTFDIYKKGLTCSINQADSNYATSLVMKYKPKSVAEMSAFVAIIRPGCASLLDDFIERKDYTTGVKELDDLLEDGKHRMIYQESIMKYLIWLGIPETGSYDIIKKIAKKKFKEPELKELKDKLLDGWKKQVGIPEGFEETWQVVQDAAKYSFNCIAGDTRIQRLGQKKESFYPTIEEMYKIKNDKNYAIKTGHKELHQKYKIYGYGNAYSMFDDKRIHKNKIVDIYYTGVQKIYRVLTKKGSYVDCTMNHKFPTPEGEKKLKDLSVGSELYIKDIKGIPALIDEIESITYLREDNVYDIEMQNPAHNFISESGLVVSNCSHSLSYAYDSLYGAYLKSHYPLEYYTVALNYYSDDSDRTIKLTKELKHFDISLEKPLFRYSVDKYFMDKNGNKIYKGTSSMKYLNKECSLYLYSLREKKFEYFIDLLKRIKMDKNEDNKSYINTRQMGILIKSNYFKEFGENKKLLYLYDMFETLFGRKSISVEKMSLLDLPNEILEKLPRTEKTYKLDGVESILRKLEIITKDESISIKEQIDFELDILGDITFTKPEIPKEYCIVLDVNTKYSPKITLYSLREGKTVICKVNKFYFKDSPLKKNDLIKCIRFEEKNKLQKTEIGWEKTKEKEWWLSGYIIVKEDDIL